MLVVYLSTGDKIAGEFPEEPGNDIKRILSLIENKQFVLFKTNANAEIALNVKQIVRIHRM